MIQISNQQYLLACSAGGRAGIRGTPFLSPGHAYAACEDGQGRLHVAFVHYWRHLYHRVYDGAKWSRPVRIYQGDLAEGGPALATRSVPLIGSTGEQLRSIRMALK